MRRTTLPLLFGLTLLAVTQARAEGELMVMPARLKVFNGHEYGVTLKNLGDAPLYLSISLMKVTNPGLTPEDKVPLSELEHPGLLANADKLTLGPGQSRAVSLKSLSVPAAEELYRLYVVPVKAMQVDAAPQDKITAPMSVSVGYGVLIHHMPPPAQQRSAWSYRCENAGVTLENTGNVHLSISDISTPDRKRPLGKAALFPGTPQHFAENRLTVQIDETRQTIDCRS
ncbi:pilus assembly protein [Achromobacter anxifer]|uniref:pilus assembly protein n=1 Tax=Achromobacter anxifer TaxID=1287737 RepID=UPI0021586A5E|nr:pilus assembly protein [Achromobacter anxifer]